MKVSCLQIKSMLYYQGVQMKKIDQISILALILEDLYDDDTVPTLFIISCFLMVSGFVVGAKLGSDYLMMGISIVYIGFFIGFCAVIIGCLSRWRPVP